MYISLISERFGRFTLDNNSYPLLPSSVYLNVLVICLRRRDVDGTRLPEREEMAICRLDLSNARGRGGFGSKDKTFLNH